MKIKDLKINPDNPQKFDDISKLVKSIIQFPKMMEFRPMVYDSNNMHVLGGNKRLTSLFEIMRMSINTIIDIAGNNDSYILFENIIKGEIPDSWAISSKGLSEHEKKRFILADNIGFGEWDLEKLELNFSEFEFDDIGLDIDFGDYEELKEENKAIKKNSNKTSDYDIDYDFPIAPELSFSDNYIIITFKDSNQFDEFVNKNNITLEKSANFKNEKLIEFEHKRIFTYEDLHTIIK